MVRAAQMRAFGNSIVFARQAVANIYDSSSLGAEMGTDEGKTERQPAQSTTNTRQPDNLHPRTNNSHRQTQPKININPRKPTQQPKVDQKHKKYRRSDWKQKTFSWTTTSQSSFGHK
jgi:hypothetical protein